MAENSENTNKRIISIYLVKEDNEKGISNFIRVVSTKDNVETIGKVFEIYDRVRKQKLPCIAEVYQCRPYLYHGGGGVFSKN